MNRAEAEQLTAERERQERDAFARRVTAVPAVSPTRALRKPAFAEGYEWARAMLLESLLEDEPTDAVD